MQIKTLHIKFLLLAFLLLGGIHNIQGQAQTQEPKWYSFEEALSKADSTDLPVLVDVWAPWCGWCHKMRQEVYPALAPDLQGFVATRLNRDANNEIHRYKGEKLSSLRIAQKLNAQTVPAIIFLTPEGDYLMHLSGYIEADKLRPVLKYISTQTYHYQNFQAYLEQLES